MAKENRIVAYPRMWYVLKLRLEAKKRECSISEIICEALFQYFSKK
jgi:hypothetical protein